MKRSLFDAIKPGAVLVIAGLACLVAAAWTWNMTAGLAATGIACLYTEWASR
ncbi:hypothetical protein Aph01nite_13240 [Acrocarpospora phusangensis]|uniref:Uncharacterized protein n=1 Tax=Acrocarpospora phusangensis TaxID=1070424 RepID=A0A919UIE5_9ACTN|nr:hypothetical protein [Acrocarpospora phusangensis]GIH23014.1 hypothetical protein Aph01nite_13240 [Acrocarpospora phusangensis]